MDCLPSMGHPPSAWEANERARWATRKVQQRWIISGQRRIPASLKRRDLDYHHRLAKSEHGRERENITNIHLSIGVARPPE